jgi:hypothetical protein
MQVARRGRLVILSLVQILFDAWLLVAFCRRGTPLARRMVSTSTAWLHRLVG